MKQNEHGRLLAAAGKRHLAPLGLKRKGQSRVWRSDQGFWIINVEFQPSGWSSGSYLNVGAQWLWREWDDNGVRFDYGYRVADFIPFESVAQFEPEAERLAALAADEVRRVRQTCQPMSVAAGFFSSHLHMWPWHRWTYDAAVALALAGNTEYADQLLSTIPGMLNAGEPADRLRATIAGLRQSLASPEEFKAAVTAVIVQQRERHKLPQQADPLSDFKEA